MRIDAKKAEANKRELFQKMMSLVAPENRDEAIKIWVDVTFEQFWLGWEQGFDAGYGNR